MAFSAGPAEISYLAQSEVIYRTVLGRMPVAVPRTGFTILDARSQKLMERYGVTLQDFFQGEEALRQRIAARLKPPALTDAMRDSEASVGSALGRLRSELQAFDPTLAAAMDRSERKIRYQLSKLDGKVSREALRRNERAAQDARSLFGLVYPERHLQERLYSILPFLAKHGLGLIDQIYQAIELECPDHRLMVV